MASDKKKSDVLGPDPFDTRLRNQFLKVSRINNKDVEKHSKELPDDSDWATWVPIDQIIKEDEEESNDDMPATH